MKALMITPYYYPRIGGLENYARQLGIALRETKGWDLVVTTSNHEGSKTVIDSADGMKVYRLGRMLKFSNTPINPLWPFMLRKIIRHEKPNIIFAHTPVPTMADAAALAHGRTPLVVFYHAATLEKGGSPLFNLVAKLYRTYESLTFKQATRIAAVSDYVRHSLPAKNLAKTVVVPNAVWQDQIHDRTQPEGEGHLVFIGSLDKTHSWKGLDQILEAIVVYKQRFSQTMAIDIIGDGNSRPTYEAQAQALGIADSVRFHGALVGKEKEKILRQATALVCYPTTANDAFPTVMLEAWALSVPVIAAGIGPIPSLITDGQDGFLVPPKQPESLAAKIQEVVAMSARDRARIATAAADRVRQNYTWELQAQSVDSLAKELV